MLEDVMTQVLRLGVGGWQLVFQKKRSQKAVLQDNAACAGVVPDEAVLTLAAKAVVARFTALVKKMLSGLLLNLPRALCSSS